MGTGARSFMRHLPLVITLLFLGLPGCASPPMRTGYLRSYDQLRGGRYLDQYWADGSLIARGKYSKIRLGAIDVGSIVDQGGVTTEQCKAWFRDALARSP